MHARSTNAGTQNMQTHAQHANTQHARIYTVTTSPRHQTISSASTHRTSMRSTSPSDVPAATLFAWLLVTVACGLRTIVDGTAVEVLTTDTYQDVYELALHGSGARFRPNESVASIQASFYKRPGAVLFARMRMCLQMVLYH